MVKYQAYKKKSFKLKQEATAWTKKEKKTSPGMGLKIEVNYNPDTPYPWEGIILKKE
jgi:hypothetical protein